MDCARSGIGRRPEARSRLPTACGTTFLMIGQCASRYEAIYQSLQVEGREALRRDLTASLRTGRMLRVPRVHSPGRDKSVIMSEIMMSERPAEMADRAVPDHWGGATSSWNWTVPRLAPWWSARRRSQCSCSGWRSTVWELACRKFLRRRDTALRQSVPASPARLPIYPSNSGGHGLGIRERR